MIDALLAFMGIMSLLGVAAAAERWENAKRRQIHEKRLAQAILIREQWKRLRMRRSLWRRWIRTLK